MKKIDCRNLGCPAPVLETKKALESLQNGQSLIVLLNSETSKENVLRFLRSFKLEPKLSQKDGEFEIEVLKNKDLGDDACSFDGLKDEKILFLKTDKVGEGELGKNLMIGFLSTLKDIDKNVKKIICVNESVLMNVDENHKAFNALKELEKMGLEIISCGACLEFYGKSKELKIGRVGNALEILNLLFDKDKIVSL